MRAPLDLTGQRFGKLVAIKRMNYQHNQGYLWLCKCDCGEEILVSVSKLRSNHTRSCGCLKPRHTKTYWRIRQIWAGMRRRCLDPKNKHYFYYGGRGITVSNDWLEFGNFYRDMGESYQDGLTIERMDNNAGYCKENCRWATPKEQGCNKRNNRIIEYNGEKLLAGDWAKRCGISRQTVISRINRGWEIEKAVLTPAINTRRNA